MSKVAAPIPATDPDEVRRQLAGKHVCPFCGVPRADAGLPCPRCSLDDSAQTRQATRQRVGPWFVLQARNPSAPGMKFTTLTGLVKRGHVTPRSIVRGPTTEQLWAFAATVRGLAREFGLCHHCGETVDPTAERCPHCGRGQAVAGDPDALLESTVAATAQGGADLTPFLPVASVEPPAAAQRPPVPPDTGMIGGTSLDLQADAPFSTRSVAAPAPAGPAAARDLATYAARPTPSRPPTAVSRVAPPPKEEAILSARELAAAFQLDFKPPGSKKPARPAGPVRTLVGLLLIAALAGAIVLGLRPDWRQTSLAWVNERWSAVAASLDQPAKPPAGATPAAVTKPPAAPPAVVTKPTPVAVAPAAPPAAPPAASSLPAPAVVERPQPPAPPLTPVLPTPVSPPPAVAAPRPAPEPAASEPDGPALSIDDATAAAQGLRNRAMDAEARRDWPAAVRIYEQAQKLPRDAWPSDLQTRLDNARRRMTP